MSRALLGKANLSSVRWAKSSQGSRRGTCGWITSFFYFIKRRFIVAVVWLEFKHLRKEVALCLFPAVYYFKIMRSAGPVVKPGITRPLHDPFCEKTQKDK